MNELTKYRIRKCSCEPEINTYYQSDVILAVEETIKRIEEQKVKSYKGMEQEESLFYSGFNDGLQCALQIIKEQFNGVISKSEQSQTLNSDTETGKKQERE